jgi:hypothetical protein
MEIFFEPDKFQLKLISLQNIIRFEANEPCIPAQKSVNILWTREEPEVVSLQSL